MIELVEEPSILGDITPPIIVDIAADDATPIDVIYHQSFAVTEQDIILQTNLANCPDVDPNMEISVFVRWQNRLYIHDPRFVLLDNNIVKPLEDGGGAIASAFANPYRPSFTTKCSNVPRTFLNQDTCYLSDSPSVCSYDRRGPYDGSGDSSGDFPYTPVEINDDFLRAIYKTTGAGEAGTVYLYAIGNLDISRDPDAEPPCRPASLSRWESGPCTGIGPIVSFATKQLISTIISYFRQETENPRLVDIYHPENLDFFCSDDDLYTVGFEVNDWDDPTFCWRNGE